MSFSGNVKEELSDRVSGSRHCRLAELAAIISYAGHLSTADGDLKLKMEAENAMLKKKFGVLLSLLFQIEDGSSEIPGADVLRILESVKMWEKSSGRIKEIPSGHPSMPCGRIKETSVIDGLLIQQSCCRRAFIRGAFLASGSISDPRKAYHFEIVCSTDRQANQLKDVINSFGLDAKIVPRKKNQVVYVKEGAHIVDLLNIMEAHVALMNLENVRIVKEMRNSVNRQVNCETANISKTVNAAVRQIEDIQYIREKRGLESLPDHLKEIALLRLEYPDASLKELGSYLNPPVGKSGVNHRLRRISEIAAEL